MNLFCYYSERFDRIGGVNGVGKDNLFKLFQHWGSPLKGELKKVIFYRALLNINLLN